MKLKTQCIRHKRYPDLQTAEKEMGKAIHKYKINLNKAYKCDYCLGYHLTKNK